MAEIRVERRRNPRFLPWLLGLLLLAAVVFAVARTVGPWTEPGNGQPEAVGHPPGTVGGPATVPPPRLP